MVRPVAIALALTALAVGCASNNGSGGALAGRVIEPQKAVFVAPIPDTTDTDGERVSGSGNAAMAALKESLEQHGILVVTQARADGYTLAGKLTHWEHHATEWNGMPDVIVLSAELSDDRTSEVVATSSARISGGSVQVTHEMPDRLLPQAAGTCLQRIYGWKAHNAGQ